MGKGKQVQHVSCHTVLKLAVEPAVASDIHLGSGCGRSCEISCASTAAAQAAPAAGFRGAASGGCPRFRKPVTMIWGPHSSVHTLCIFNLILRDWTSKVIRTSSTLVCCVVHGGSELRHPHCL